MLLNTHRRLSRRRKIYCYVASNLAQCLQSLSDIRQNCRKEKTPISNFATTLQRQSSMFSVAIKVLDIVHKHFQNPAGSYL